MGPGIQWGIRRGKIALLVVLLMLLPLRTTGSYNTFFREFNFNFPKNDVVYSPEQFSKASPKIISLPSMDIIGASVALITNNFLNVKMMFGGNLYTNSTTVYEFYAEYSFNSTTSAEIFVGNSYNYSINAYNSINQSKVYIYLSKIIKQNNTLSFYRQFTYYISPTIKADTITWSVDMTALNNYLPLLQIFTGTYFSNQTNISYQGNFNFRFSITNFLLGGGYDIYIHNEYTINHVGVINPSPFPYLYPMLWAISLIAVSVITYFLNRRHQRSHKN